MLTYDFTTACAPHGGPDAAGFDAVLRRLPAAEARLRALAEPHHDSFLVAPDTDVAPVIDLAERVTDGIDTLVVIGIGGSSLGAKAVYQALVRPHSGTWRLGGGAPRARLVFLENVDPVETRDLLDGIDWRRALVNVVTKSGGTVETMASFLAVRQHLIELGGLDFYRSRVVATTDPSRGALRALVREDDLASLPVPSGVGGRFSVFTPVGLFPLAAAGVDVMAFLGGAAAARDAALGAPLAGNPSSAFAAVQVALFEQGVTDVVFMPYVTSLDATAAWFVQLWAESLGKLREGVPSGPTPIRALGATDQHSQLQLFMQGPANKNVVFVETRTDPDDVEVPAPPESCADLAHLGCQRLSAIRAAELAGVRAALAEVRRPTSTLSLDRVDAQSMGQLMMSLACSTALAGWMLGVDPFDQPGVELAKRYAHGVLGRPADAAYAERLRTSAAAAPRISRLG